MRVILIVFSILGCFLGAGFVSGREVAGYFSVFGKYSIIGILFLTIILFLLLILFMVIANKVDNFKHFVNIYFGKYSFIMNFLFAFTMLIFMGSMIAGTGVLAECFDINKYFVILLTVILTYILVIKGSSSLRIINSILMPIILCVLVYLTFPKEWNFNVEGDLFEALLSAFNYGFINIIPLGIFIVDIKGKKKFSKKEIILIASVSTILICVMLLIYNNAIIVNELEYFSMPILVLSNGRGIFIKLITAVCLYLGMFTTLISCVFVFTNYVNSYIKNYKHSTMLSLFFGFFSSLFGFDAIVGYAYIIIAIIGIYVVLNIVIKEKRSSFRTP